MTFSIRRRRAWDLPDAAATPEAAFLNRRTLVGGVLGVGALGLAGASILAPAPTPAVAATDPGPDPTADLYPAKRNETYALDRPLTPERFSGDYNNYYEFSTSKSVAPLSEKFRTRPWTLSFDGLLEKPFEIGVDDLIRKMPLEERLYRHRCVEAWSMTVPWTGFPLSALVALAKPASGAKYVRMQTFFDKSQAPGQRGFFYPWPYTEGLTMEEAGSDLAFVATGVYGKPLPNQFGAPIRLVVPWKYGFKSVKAITKVSFTADRPKTFWEGLQASEYGFWANVNPEVPHPRWSQARERVLGTDEIRPTLLYNGYAEQVAPLYKNLASERLFA